MTDDELEAQIRAQVALRGWRIKTPLDWPHRVGFGGYFMDVWDARGGEGCLLDADPSRTRREALEQVSKFLKELK